MDREGLKPDGQRPADLPRIDGLARQVFESDTGLEEPLNETSEGIYWVFRVNEIQAEHLRPLEEVRDRVVEALMSERRMDALRNMAQSHVERMRAGETTLARIADEVGGEVTTLENLRRQRPADPLGSSLLGEIFQAEEEDVVSGRASDSGGYVIATVREVSLPTGEGAEDNIASRVAQLTPLIENDLLTSYVSGLKEDFEVRRYPETLRQALTNYGAI